MNTEMVLYIGKQALWTALMLAGPMLAVALAVGLLTAMLQAVTSIRDMTLGLVLKIAGVGVTLLLVSGWMLHVALGFAKQVFNHMQSLVQ
jgi:flagellar biosynthetic protein FliQ